MLDLSALPELDFGQDTLLDLTTLQSHLAWISGRKKLNNSKDDSIHSLPFQRIQNIMPSSRFSHDKDVTFFELADFERWVESHVEHYMLNGRMLTTAKSRGKGKDVGIAHDQSKTIKLGANMRILRGFKSELSENEIMRS